MKLEQNVVALAEKIYSSCLGAMAGRSGPLFMQGKVDHIALGSITSAQAFFSTKSKYEAALSGRAAPPIKATTQHAKSAEDLLQQIAAEAAAAREAERSAAEDNGAARPPSED